MDIITTLFNSRNPLTEAIIAPNAVTPSQYSFPVHKNLSGDELGNCPSCGSQHLQKVAATPPHGQKLVCSNCQKFIKWLPSQKSVERHQELKARLESLKDKVSGWDSAFVDSLSQKLRLAERDGKVFKISPRQLECLKKIEDKNNSSGDYGIARAIAL